nr:putative sterigmatocystin biosynthesis p450 monooxygenase [Quercus suber]
MEAIFTLHRLAWAIGVILLTLLVRFVQQLHFHRRLFRNLPGPPHSYIWGHLPCINTVLRKMPKRFAPQTLSMFLQEEFGLSDYFYVDSFPFGFPILFIHDPDLMHQMTVQTSTPKHPVVDEFMTHIGGPGNLVSSEGSEWKRWRSAFNPGFSAAHLVTLAPQIIEECNVFCDIMTERAKNKTLFRMEPASTRLTVDIIGRVILDLSFRSQSGPNEFVDAFVKQVQWSSIGAQFNPIELIDFRRPIVQKYLTWKMDRYTSRALDERFASREQRGRSKVVVDLALEAYMKEVKGATGEVDLSKIKTISSEFKRAAISNLKTFIFAGHDTTSSTIAYIYYYLAKYPATLSKLRAEHDAIFGPDASNVASHIQDDPRLLNRLEYTMAVIREALRLQPPASTIRKGTKGFFLHDSKTGEALPTENFMLWPVDVGLQRHPVHWAPDPHTFRPERHLSSSGSDASANYTSNPAWVAFSKGPRNCIGQELAILETKIIIAMTVRRFVFTPAFGELDSLKGDGTGYPSDSQGLQTQFGEEAYQIQLGTAKPREGMPMRVALLNFGVILSGRPRGGDNFHGQNRNLALVLKPTRSSAHRAAHGSAWRPPFCSVFFYGLELRSPAYHGWLKVKRFYPADRAALSLHRQSADSAVLARERAARNDGWA